MSELAPLNIIWAMVLHAVGSPGDALVRVVFEGWLVYSLCCGWHFVSRIRWSPRPLLRQSYLCRAWKAYGPGTAVKHSLVLLPLDVLRGLFLSIPQGFCLAPKAQVKSTKGGCALCGEVAHRSKETGSC